MKCLNLFPSFTYWLLTFTWRQRTSNSRVRVSYVINLYTAHYTMYTIWIVMLFYLIQMTSYIKKLEIYQSCERHVMVWQNTSLKLMTEMVAFGFRNKLHNFFFHL